VDSVARHDATTFRGWFLLYHALYNPAAAGVNRRPAPRIRVAVDPRLHRLGSLGGMKKPTTKGNYT
jgi:hypothetical protein